MPKQLFTSELLNDFGKFLNLFWSLGFNIFMEAFQFFKFLWILYVILILFLCLQLCFQLTNFSSEPRTLLSGVADIVLGSFLMEKNAKGKFAFARILISKYNY